MLSLHVNRTRLLGTTLGGALMLPAAVAIACGFLIKPRIYRCFCDSKEESQKLTVRQIAGEGFLVWTRKNKRSGCPATLMEVASEIDRKDTKDIWGRELVWYCGADLPPSAKGGFAVMSLGPDGVHGTKDDIASWR